MPYSYVVYTGNGSTTQFAITFPYIRKEHVKVYVNYVDTAYTYVNDTTVQLAAAPASPLRVEVRRVTPLSTRLVDYADGSTLVAADLDTSNLQSLYNEQELDDNQKRGIFVDDATGLITAGGQRITNVANPVNAQDAATKTYVDTADALKVAKAGDSMTGPLAMGTNKITNLGTPTVSTDAVTKAYIDGYINTTYLGPLASDPATRPGGAPLQIGDQYFNTTQNIVKAWTGTVWVISAAAGNIIRWRKTASAGNTTLSGVDDLGITLSYVVGNEQVYLNGALQTRGVDYTAATGTSITLTPALLAGDVVELHAVQGYVSATITPGSINDALVAPAAGIQATKLSFTQAGTGAIARTVDSKLEDVVSVKDFGAIGDGITSDTTAVQAAINAAAGSKAVFFPAGTYLCVINLPSNSTIYGEGQQTVLKLPNSSGRSLIQSSDTINGTDNCQVFSLQIDGNIANNNSTLCNGVFVDGACDNWVVQNLTIKNTGGNGVRVRGSGSTGLTTSAKRILIANNVLDNCGVKNSTTGADGIYLNGCQLAQVVNNRVDYAGRQAIALEGSVATAIATRQVIVSGNICTNAISGGIDDEADEGGDLIISGNIILDCPGVGVRAIGKTGNTVISGNLARNVGTGVDAENDQTIPSSLIISNNIFRQIVGEGIKVNLASNTNVIGNTIYDAGSSGIFITGDNSNNWKIANNIIDTTVGSGILVNRSGTGFNIFNNSILNAGTSGSTQPGINVSITGGGSLDYGNIADNHVRDNRTPAGTSYAYRFAGINYVALKGNIAQGAATGDVQWASVTPTNIQLRGNRWVRSTWSGAPTTYTFLEDDGIQLGGINSLPSVGLNTTGFSVGTLAPQGLFETAASGVTANAFLTGGAGNNAETAGLRFGSGSGRGARIAGFRGSSSNIHSLDFYSYNSADVFGMRLTSTGLGIGTIASPANQLQLSTDSAGKPSTALWTIVSDERIKEDIELADLDLCYEAIKAIPLKRYKWRDDIYTSEQVIDRHKLGWIAQDVEAVFPKAVGTHAFRYNQVFEETIIPASAELLDDKGNVTLPAQPERIEKGELISEDVIEDCRDLNSDQIYAAMYGAIQKLISKVENLEAQVATLTSTEPLQ